MGSTTDKPARAFFPVAGIILIFFAILSSAYSYYYFEDHQQLGSGGPLLIFEITMICIVLALLSGLLIGMYVEARRVKKGQKSSPP